MGCRDRYWCVTWTFGVLISGFRAVWLSGLVDRVYYGLKEERNKWLSDQRVEYLPK